MKLIDKFLFHRTGGLILGALLAAIGVACAQNTPFSFNLDEPCITSAGVFQPDGTLVRTLWSKVSYGAGAHGAIWDGLDDNSNAATAGIFHGPSHSLFYSEKLRNHGMRQMWQSHSCASGKLKTNLW